MRLRQQIVYATRIDLAVKITRSRVTSRLFLHVPPKPQTLTRQKKIKTNIKHQDQETRLLNKPISPRRLREGGAAILQALNKNHHMAILGIKLIKPLLTKRLRLPKRS